MVAPDRQYHSLEDFLASTMSHIDGVLDDGFGFGFPAKGREIDAVVLFADISGFSTRTLEMSPAETLIYVQNFFAWVTQEALHGRPGIVDKYIGDEVMVVYSKEFGSEDPFVDAVQAAAAMSRRDVHAYQPHMGIASGPVIVGYAGTPMRYNVSVFGAPVALAARCAGVRQPEDSEQVISSTIAFPAADWADRELDLVLPPGAAGSPQPESRIFELQEAREVPMKGLDMVEIREIYNTGMWMPMQGAEERAKESLAYLAEHGRYWPRWDNPLG
ncbi:MULTISPECIES: adenylate/guanylate cyclase domain-containing protein [unclassified Aeromicrobium]|uniref:adenylate/guanylate cyclase domain-containing protein n=1 Tax=unclassified Aeromicrobium TaxID=2633570 RepID=UPI00396B260C